MRLVASKSIRMLLRPKFDFFFFDFEIGSARVLMCNGFVWLLIVDTRDAVLVFILELLVP